MLSAQVRRCLGLAFSALRSRRITSAADAHGTSFGGGPLRRTAMKLRRRQFLHLTAAAFGLSAVSRMANAQAYPARPVRVFVGFAAGGAPDIAARLMAQWLSERLGQQFIIENRPGAGSNIATE